MDTYVAVASKRDWRSYAERPIPDDVETRILDAGRLAGSAVNRQPWTFVVVENPDVKERLAETVYAQDNVRTAPLVIAVATEGGGSALDVGRAMQNMFLVAWNEGVVSCPNGMPDPEASASVLGLADRGRLQPGLAADVVIFDPQRIRGGQRRTVYDLPGHQPRLIQQADGIHTVIVNGEVVLEENQHTGALPGQVVRGA